MTEKPTPNGPAFGTITWVDLTVNQADETREFYQQVAPWKSQGVDMGDYEDFCMDAANGETVAGICHARGENQGIPPQWMIYINVDDIEDRCRKCESFGGKIVQPPRKAGGGQCAILQDPTGAAFGLYQS